MFSRPVLIFVLLAAVVFLALAQVYDLSFFAGSLDQNRFGDVATWFAGVMTLAAVAVALHESYKSGQRERADDDRRITSVTPWLEIDSGHWLLRIDNRSERVVEAWSIDFPLTNVHLCWRDAGPCPPGLMTFSLERVRNLPTAVSNAFPDYVFRFVDAREEVWQRESSGQLSKAKIAPGSFRQHSCSDVDGVSRA
jgi:hypothetical protein